MSELRLTGLDGKNPLAFMATLGVLNALSDRVKQGQPAPKLVWRAEGTFVPAIVDGPGREGLIELLGEDVQSFRHEAAIEGLHYQKAGGGAAHDLKPPPGGFADYLTALTGNGPQSPGLRRSLSFAGAFDLPTPIANASICAVALRFAAFAAETRVASDAASAAATFTLG